MFSRARYPLLPTTSMWNVPRPAPPRRLIFLLATAVTCVLVVGWISYPDSSSHRLPIAQIPVVGEKDGTGRIQMDLGIENGDARYDLDGVTPTPRGAGFFFKRLNEFATTHLPAALHTPMLHSLDVHKPPSLRDNLTGAGELLNQKPMIDFRNIFQTDNKSAGKLTQEWIDMNKADGWELDFYSDERAVEWIDKTFGNTDEPHSVKWAYHIMPRGVLKADFLRYLLPLVHGGFYSDTDTKPVRPILQWGKKGVEYYDISATDGPDWQASIAPEPEVLIGIDLDVHEKTEYFKLRWPQPLGICQWALSSAPYHPILQEVTRRIVANTETVAQTQEETKNPKFALPVLKWTGPQAFSDSVLTYLLARYHVPWQHLRGRRTPIRIGEVMILPITGFSPEGEKDFGAEDDWSEQNVLIHMFKGSWKFDGL